MLILTTITVDQSVPIRKMWTIRQPVEWHCHHTQWAASSGNYCAIFDLLVEPHTGTDAVVFVNQADVQKWVPAVIAGIKQFLQDRANEGIAVRGIKVTLADLKDHPVDAHERAFTKFAAQAMKTIFEGAGVEQNVA